jgi:dUTP pyrophosphatase
MDSIRIRCRVEPGMLPCYQSSRAAGADLLANIPSEILLRPGAWVLVPTGVRLELPEGYEAQVRPRSGLAAKHAVTVLNAPGTVDADYRGEISVILVNHGTEQLTVRRGMRVAQLVIAPVVRATFELVPSLEETEREEGGFGSTGL